MAPDSVAALSNLAKFCPESEQPYTTYQIRVIEYLANCSLIASRCTMYWHFPALPAICQQLLAWGIPNKIAFGIGITIVNTVC